MTSAATASTPDLIEQRPQSRLVAAVGTVWTAVMGVLPHVLHHVGPLAGAAVVAGTTGTVVFGLAAFVFTIPLLLRVHRHCGSWRLPGLLLTAFISVWLVSTFVAGPWIRDQIADEAVATQQGSASEVGDRQAGGDASGDEEHDGHHESDESK